METEKGWWELRKRAWYCGWRDRVRKKREGAGGRQEYMKASCINGKVKSRLRINYPVSPGITNVIIWTRVLIRMCRGVEDLRYKMGDRDGAVSYWKLTRCSGLYNWYETQIPLIGTKGKNQDEKSFLATPNFFFLFYCRTRNIKNISWRDKREERGWK